MLDHHAFLHHPKPLRAALARRGVPPQLLDELTQKVEARRTAIGQAEALRRQLNEASEAIKAAVTRDKDPNVLSERRSQLRSLKVDVQAAIEAEALAEAAVVGMMLELPNPPDSSVPTGTDANDNQEIRRYGEPRSFDFTPKNHWELLEKLGLVSFEQASKMSGARFAVMHGVGARLERALTALMLDMAQEAGFSEVAVPLLVLPQSMEGAGQYPKFRGEAFETQDGQLVLIPTSEVPLLNLHRDEVLDDACLPLRYTAATPCFRREAGAAGRDTRGLIRLHQFTKVELFSVTRPADSAAEHERITRHAEAVLQRLGLPYRTMLLCSGDMGFAATKTYDLEVWLPAQSAYREISSCSSCSDFQARRAKIRYRPQDEGKIRSKPQMVHTLNGSSLAVGRTLVAVVENYQRADGSLTVPEALRPYMGGLEHITGA